MSATAVIDIGKTNARVALVDASGAVLETASAPNETLVGEPYPHADLDALERFALGALARFARMALISTVVPAAHGASGVLVGEDGPVLPLLDYEHDGPEEVAAAYAAVRPPFEETFSPPLPLGLNLGRQLFWQQARFGDRVAAARAFLTQPQYWAWRLSGIMASEVASLGAHTDLWAPARGEPSSLVRKQGWARLFTPRRAAFEALGPVTARVVALTGLRPDTRVLAGVHDSNASLLPHLTRRKAPFAMVSTGTWVIAFHVGGDVARLDPATDMLANVDVLGRPVPCARFMGGRERAAIVGDDVAPPCPAMAARLMDLGVMALPAFAETGGAWLGRRGAVAGALPDEPGARATLASLYVALVTDDALERLGVTGPVVVDGPFAADAVFLAALAALRPGQRIESAGEATSSALGAALLARWGGSAETPTPTAAVAPLAADLATYRARWRAALA